jgi:hypothetical protein
LSDAEKAEQARDLGSTRDRILAQKTFLRQAEHALEYAPRDHSQIYEAERDQLIRDLHAKMVEHVAKRKAGWNSPFLAKQVLDIVVKGILGGEGCKALEALEYLHNS